MASEKDFNVTRMRHFAKLHERIQSKYNEMQKKLEKSKSIDSLTTADEYSSFKDNIKFSSTNDLRDDVFVNNGSNDKGYPLMHTMIVEDINKIEVTYSNIDSKEVSVSESESSTSINTKPRSPDVRIENADEDYEEFTELADDIKDWILNNEPLLESDTRGDESASTSPSQKLTLRSKIGSRLSLVRERRRESKEKKLVQKQLEKESRESKDKSLTEIRLETSKSDKLLFSSSLKSDVRLRDRDRRRDLKVATITIAVIEVTGLDIDPEAEERRSLQCRFRFGLEKYKTKNIKHVVTPVVKWQELFNMNMYNDSPNHLEITLLDTDRKDATIGRTSVDITELDKEKTHVMKLPLEGVMRNAEILYLLTITGTPFDDLLVDLDYYHDYQTRLESQDEEFNFFRVNDFFKVGRLSVIVFGAKGLALPDCYCYLKLVNERRQTHTEYKTNEPNWMKSFTFNVTDITSILEVAVVDERKDEEVGRVVIPLLRVRNGEKVWYALKDETLRERAKGHDPKILLEMRVSWNLIKGSVRVLRPKEIDYLATEDKFDRKLFFKNVARSKVVMYWTLDFLTTLKSCFEWESKKWNAIWLVVWLTFNWYFSPWMVPLILIIPFLWYRPPNYYIFYWKRYLISPELMDKVRRRSIRQKINNLQDLIYTVQNLLGKLASFGESVKNLFNFTVPYLSLLAIFFILSITLVIYFIPVKYILMGWGIKKYVRKIIWPNRVPHSEVIDLISRVPDDEELYDCDPLPLESSKSALIDKV